MNNHLSLFEKHIDIVDQKQIVVDLIAKEIALSKQQIKSVMQKGAVWLTSNGSTQRIRRAKKVVKPGDVVHVYYDEKVLSQEVPVPTLISDQGDYSIWYKPYGLRSQGSKWGDHCTINRWIENNTQPQRSTFIVHRLDRAATGLMIIAHKKSIAAQFSEMFKQRLIEKRYRVVVHGQFQKETLRIDSDIDNRKSVSLVSLIEYDEKKNRSLLEVLIETGRKHQIRRHLSEAGFPVVGDRLYGIEGDEEDLQLTAFYLRFVCPVVGEEKEFVLGDEFVPCV